MSAQENIDSLITLMQLDIDAAHAYEQAMENIDIPEIRDRLDEFREDHEHHIEALSAAIGRLGGQLPERSPDFKGYLIEGYTAVRAYMGIAGALRAMKMNEVMANTLYERARTLDLPDDIKGMIERNCEDERRHLAYIESVLEDRVWELDPASGQRFSSDLGRFVPLALGGFLLANAFMRPSKGSAVGGVIGAALLFAATQSGVNPGRLIPARSLAGGRSSGGESRDRRSDARSGRPAGASIH